MEKEFHTIEDIERFLNTIPMFGKSGSSAANFNLERMKGFCEFMGNPEQQFSSVHVAGTNGKGTVCRMLASVYQKAGYKTGLYTSPHLTDVRERFQIDASQIGTESLLQFFNTFARHIKDAGYTYFEITTAVAFWYFATEQTDIAMIETGLGGRLDATNVIQPELSVITSVGLDHTDLLGNTFEKIAFEKGGIIKKGKPVVIGNLTNEAETVIRNIAIALQSRVVKAAECNPVIEDGFIRLNNVQPPVRISNPVAKNTDALNAAIAYKSVEELYGRFPVSKEEFINGISERDNIFPVTGTFEKLISGRDWFFDGGHNPEAVFHITETMKRIAPPESWSVVLSFMADKVNRDVAAQWNPFPNLYVYQMNSPRAASLALMKRFFPGAKTISQENDILSNQFKTELVIFSGSFYFYNEVSKWMGTIIATENKSFRTR
jgi:dihydrofolate synthase / folylpolyglutamate synthase